MDHMERSGQRRRVTVTFPSEAVEKLKAAAKLHRRSLNSEVVFAVERHLAQHAADADLPPTSPDDVQRSR